MVDPFDAARKYSSVSSGSGSSMIDSQSGWTPATVTASWILLKLNGATYIRGIVTKGRQDTTSWVTAYTVHESIDGVTFSRIATFVGNTDAVSGVYNLFETTANFIRIVPVNYSSAIGLRVALVTVSTYRSASIVISNNLYKRYAVFESVVSWKVANETCTYLSSQAASLITMQDESDRVQISALSNILIAGVWTGLWTVFSQGAGVPTQTWVSSYLWGDAPVVQVTPGLGVYAATGQMVTAAEYGTSKYGFVCEQCKNSSTSLADGCVSRSFDSCGVSYSVSAFFKGPSRDYSDPSQHSAYGWISDVQPNGSYVQLTFEPRRNVSGLFTSAAAVGNISTVAFNVRYSMRSPPTASSFTHVALNTKRSQLFTVNPLDTCGSTWNRFADSVNVTSIRVYPVTWNTVGTPLNVAGMRVWLETC